MQQYGIIYLLINKVNGKMYVGQTINFNKRMSCHLQNSKKENPNCLIDKKIKQYGWNNFENHIIDICRTNQEDLNLMEINSIQYFGTKVENGGGYNVKNGGSYGKHSEKTKEKISLFHKGRRKGIKQDSEHVKKRIARSSKTKTLTVSDIKIRLVEIHNEQIIIDEQTYINTQVKCKFIDKNYGEWWAIPNNILRGAKHPIYRLLFRNSGGRFIKHCK